MPQRSTQHTSVGYVNEIVLSWRGFVERGGEVGESFAPRIVMRSTGFSLIMFACGRAPSLF
jgi:hypothetical protein